MKRSSKPADIAHAEDIIAKAAESYPDVVEEGPWGHRAFKVRKKTFLFLAADAEGLSFSVKLPTSNKTALSLGFTSPTEYGLGKAGWVTARFAPKDSIPLPTIRAWLDESFRAIAPAKLARLLDDSDDGKSPKAAKAQAKRATAPAKRTVKAKRISSGVAKRDEAAAIKKRSAPKKRARK